MRLIITVGIVFIATSAAAQVPALVAASNLPDGNMQMLTMYDYETSAYHQYSVTKKGSSIRLFDYQTSSYKNFDVKLTGTGLTVWDYSNPGYHTYSVTRSGSQVTIFDPQHPGYQTLSLFTAAPMVMTPQTLPYSASPLGSALETIGKGLQQLAHDHAVRKQMEEQQQALATLKAQIDELKRQQELSRKQDPPPVTKEKSPLPAPAPVSAVSQTPGMEWLTAWTQVHALRLQEVVTGWSRDTATANITKLVPAITFTIINPSTSQMIGPIDVRVTFSKVVSAEEWGSATLVVPPLAPGTTSTKLTVRSPQGYTSMGMLYNGNFTDAEATVSAKIGVASWSPMTVSRIQRTVLP